ncbi:MAG TPA: S8 family serine peptidase [Thermoanaerobaculia bacterium]|nr:S8 family serine peptidase [Thermoanaerobaculia bacterium]
MWDHVLGAERLDLAAFESAGWRFIPRPEAPDSFIGPNLAEKGLLTRHPQDGLVIVRDRLVVGLAEGVRPSRLKRLHPEMRRLPFGKNVHEIAFELPDENIDDAVAFQRLRLEDELGAGAVRFVDPVLIYNVEGPPQPPLFATTPPPVLDSPVQWQWDQIELTAAWAVTDPRRGDDTLVAVIDRGFFESSQLNIARHIDHRGDPITTPMRHRWHGTFCAALVGGTLQDNFGNGAAPNCRLILVAMGETVSSVELAAALKTSMANGADVISCSVAPRGRSWDGLDTVLAAVDEVENDGRGGRGTLVVLAVFNENRRIDPGSLEAHEPIVCVAPSDRNDVRAPASGFGAGLDLIAPGVSVPGLAGTDNLNAGLARASGGSFAAPCVAGVASLMLSVNPELTAERLRNLLWESADPVVVGKQRSDEVGWGRLNALQAVQAAIAAVPTAVVTPVPSPVPT